MYPSTVFLSRTSASSGFRPAERRARRWCSRSQHWSSVASSLRSCSRSSSVTPCFSSLRYNSRSLSASSFIFVRISLSSIPALPGNRTSRTLVLRPPGRHRTRYTCPRPGGRVTDELGVFEAIHSLRGIRQFEPDDIASDSIREILEAATRAPSPQNSQPWAFLVVRDAGTRKQIAEIYRRVWNLVK